MTNPFDQFDAPAQKPGAGGNPFDQFDTPGQKPGAPSWSEVPGNFVSAIPGNAAEKIAAIPAFVQHLPETIQNMFWDMPKAAASKLMRHSGIIDALIDRKNGGDEAGAALDKTIAGQKAQGREKIMNDAWEGLKARYGGEDQLKNTLSTDPVGFLMDLGGVLSGGEMAAGKAGMTGTASAIAKANSFVDPTQLALKAGTGAVKVADNLAVKPVTALLSGTSRSAQTLATQAGVAGGAVGRAFREQMAAPNAETVVDTARRGVEALGRERQAQYLADKNLWANDASHLDFQPVLDSLSDAQKKVLYGGLPQSQKALKVYDELDDIVNSRRLQAQLENIPDPTPTAPPPVAGQAQRSAVSGPGATITTPAQVTPGQTIPGAPYRVEPTFESKLRADMSLQANRKSGKLTATEVPRTERGVTPDTVIPEQVTPGTSMTVRPQSPSLGSTFDDIARQQDAAKAGPHAPRMSGPTGTGVMGPHGSPHYTAQGFDKMKQAVGELMYDTNKAPEGTLGRNIAGDVYGKIKSEIERQAPGYATAMRNYGEASDVINDMRRTLSLGEKGARDTAMGKLQTTLRDDVSGRYGTRRTLLDTLAQHEPTLPYMVAGQAFNDVLPRGIVGRAGAGLESMAALHGALTTPLSPTFLAHMAVSSPRLIGNARYGAGAAARGARKAGVTHKNIGRTAQAAHLSGLLSEVLEPQAPY